MVTTGGGDGHRERRPLGGRAAGRLVGHGAQPGAVDRDVLAALRRARAGEASCRRSDRAGAAKQGHPENVFVASPSQLTSRTSFAINHLAACRSELRASTPGSFAP